MVYHWKGTLKVFPTTVFALYLGILTTSLVGHKVQILSQVLDRVTCMEF
jgi:hypothetical protein